LEVSLARIFLSHSSLNSRETVALYKWLIEQDPSLDGEIFLDLDPRTGIATGANWREELKRASKRCEAVICLLSAEWDRSEECRREYWIAEQLDKQIFCARLEPSAGEELMAKWQSCDLFGGTDKVSIEVPGGEPVTFAREGLRRLSTGIRRAGISVTTFPWPPNDDPNRAPYRGWEPFEPVDAGIFFGRDGELARAMDELREMRQSTEETLFVVLGASGAGKSSFLRAGIVPRVHKDDRHFLDLGILRPERHALTGETGLAQSIWTTRNRLGMTSPPLGEIKAACVDADVAQIRGWLVECRDAAAARLLNVREIDMPPTVVLPLDQAEELFAVDAGVEATQLLELIREIATGEDGFPLIVAATIRTDSYPVMQTAPELEGLLTRQFDLLPMRTVQFKEVITGPARRLTAAGVRLAVDDTLVERLLSDCASGADMLPLLSLMLASLYRDYGSTHRLTVAAYEALGGLNRVVQMKVDEVLSPDPGQRKRQLASLRSAFIPWLATINPASNQAMRRIARYADLPEPSRPLIDAFVAQRLLVKDVHGSDVVVEVALEILLRQWDDLAAWLAEERDNLKAADDLEYDAAEWRQSGQDPSWLLEGTRLANAEKLLATPGFRERLVPTNDYVQASRDKGLYEAREKQRAAEKSARRLRSLLTITIVVALVAVAGLVFALRSRGQAVESRNDALEKNRDATAQKVVLKAQAMLANTVDGNDDRAFQLLLAANKLAATDSVRKNSTRALVDALVQRFSTVRISTDPVPVVGAAVSPNGRWLAAATGNGLIRMWDTESAAWQDNPLDGARLLRAQVPLASVAISPDGTRVIGGTGDGKVLEWNTTETNPSDHIVGRHTGTVTSVVFSPDGKQVASAGADGWIHIWRPGEEPYRSIRTGGPTFSLAFDPVRNRLASANTEDTFRLWNTDTGESEAAVQAHTAGVMSVAFSPDGALIASGGADGTVRLWDALSSESNEVGTLTSAFGRGHTEAVMSVAFNADGTRLVSSGVDFTVQMWDVARRERIGDPMTGHEGVVWRAVFVDHSRQIVSAGNDHQIRVWNADVGQPISAPLAPKRGAERCGQR
jgi:WD40 repeat protein